MHLFLVVRVLGLFALLFAATLTAPLLLVWLYDEPNPWPYLLPMLGALGLGEVTTTFASVSDPGKLLAVAAMILGRLEIFTILVLLTPGFRRD